MRRLSFTDHRRELDDNRYVYAVVSRRSAGLSIGVNLNPDKVCNFDCPYCQVDRTTPTGKQDVDIARLAQEIDHLLALCGGDLWSLPPFDTTAPQLRQVVDISIAGDGEPTAARSFGRAVDAVVRARADHGLDHVQLHLLTNATLFHRDRVWEALERWSAAGGQIWAKLDAGTEAWYRVVDASAVPFERILANLERAARAWPLTLQCMFMTWQGEGPSQGEIDAWADRLGALVAAGGRIACVQVCSVARRPADDRVGVLPTEQLERIAARARDLGLQAIVVPGVPAATL